VVGEVVGAAAGRGHDASKRETLWRLYVQPAFGSWPLASIQSWDVETWVARMAKDQVRPHSAAESVRLLKHMLADAVRHRVIRANQAELVKTPTTAAHDDRILDDAEIPGCSRRSRSRAIAPAYAAARPAAGARRGEPGVRRADARSPGCGGRRSPGCTASGST
jgi:hypothetical protein